MKSHFSLLALVCVLFLAIRARGATDEVKVTLRTDKNRYKVGETIRFNLVYTNVSDRPISVLTQTDIYPVSVLVVERTGDKRRPEKILAPGEMSIAWDALARQVVRLRPQAQTTRVLKAEVRSVLPSFYENTRKGIFLILPASALRLYGTGDYEIRARFYSSRDHPVNAYLLQDSKLWRGDVMSNPVMITIN